MATIALDGTSFGYSMGMGAFDALGNSFSSAKNSTSDLQKALNTLKLKIDVASIVVKTELAQDNVEKAQERENEKSSSLSLAYDKLDALIRDVGKVDHKVSEKISAREDDFYQQYSYFKPDCKKTKKEQRADWWAEKWRNLNMFCVGVIGAIANITKDVVDWAKEHWKLVVTVVICIAAIVLICTGVGGILGAAAIGALIGAGTGGLLGGVSSVMTGGSFLKGFENGAFSGAITGAIFGGIGGAGSLLGNALGKSCALVEKFETAIKLTSKISTGVSVAMDGFDTIAFGIGMFDSDNVLVNFNQQLHSNGLYNAFQIGVNALATFSGGMVNGISKATPACFVAGTLVMTAMGLVAIECIKTGDYVLSADTDTMQTDYKRVLETYIRKVDVLIHLTVNGEEIITTVDHPFYVKGQGFVNAAELCIGNVLVNSDGDELTVEKIFRESCHDEKTTVYNFQVEDYHTYFVGNCAVWVHNAGYKDVNIKEFEVKDKHLKNSTAKRARKFNVDTSGEANMIVQDALENGKQIFISDNGIGTQGQESYIAIIDTEKIIGTKGETCIKIVYDEMNTVWTTYPVPTP